MTAYCLMETDQRQFRANDDEAKSDPVDLILEEMPRLRRYAQYLTRNTADADDLSQESLATALAKVNLWRRGTNMRAWLFTIQRNLFINGLRKAARAPIVADGNAACERIGAPPRQEHRLYVQEVKEEFGALNREHRQVIDLVVLGGLSYEQAAAQISVPIGTVRSRLSRARETLKHGCC